MLPSVATPGLPVIVTAGGALITFTRAEARAILDKLLEESERRYVSRCGIGMIYVALGEPDEAFHWLERAYAEHDGEVFNLKVEPRFHNIRGDRRYQDLLDRVGLSDGLTI